MNCKEIKEHLWAYLTGEIDPALTQIIEGHAGPCSVCSKEVSLLRNIIENLPETPKYSDAYWESYSDKIINRLQNEKVGKPFLSLRVAMAMALLFVIAGSVTFYRVEEKKKIDEIVSELELLENLGILEREDFDDLVSNEKS